MIVLSQHDKARDAAIHMMHFFADESCGQCTPCREGTGWMWRMVDRIERGQGRNEDLDTLTSVAGNIAEGAARQTRPELLQFLYIANGSLSELDTHLEIARRLSYLENADDLQDRLNDVQGQLLAVIQSLKRRSR